MEYSLLESATSLSLHCDLGPKTAGIEISNCGIEKICIVEIQRLKYISYFTGIIESVIGYD